MARAFLVVASALVGVLPTLADSSSTSDYVQDGLVAHWDAIDNTGSGHDGAAATWTDLKGGRAFTLSNTATWGKNFVRFSGAAGSGGMLQDSALLAFDEAVTARTVEVVCEFSDTMYYSAGAFFVGTADSGIALTAKWDWGVAANRGLTTLQSSSPASALNLGYGPNTLSCGYVRDETATRPAAGGLYLNGRVREQTTATPPDTAAGSYICIGRDNNGGSRLSGYVYSVRIYNRLLTPAEIAANQVVDAKRFAEKTEREFYVDAENGVDDVDHDGTSPEKAKHSLSEIFKIANQPHDVVWALPGTYADGGFTTTLETKNNVEVKNRCVIPAKVRLESTGGASVTFIKGAKTEGAEKGVGEDSIRAVYMNPGSKLYGFTLTDSSTIDNASIAGGALWVGGRCIVKDCVISNCASKGGIINSTSVEGASYPEDRSVFLRCVMQDNESGSATTRGIEGSCYAAVNCRLSLDESYYMVYPGAGTIFVGTTIEGLGKVRVTDNGHLYGCYYEGERISNDKAMWKDCLFASQSAYDGYVAAGQAEGCSTGTDTVDGANESIYADVYRQCAWAYSDEMGLTVGGAQRVFNRVLDFGAEEFDWRPIYATDLAPQRVAVTTATPGVYETAEKRVALTGGDELVVDWTAPAEGVNEYSMDVEVSGAGILLIYLGEATEPFATVTSADGVKTVDAAVAGSPTFRFAFTGAGEARLSGFKDTISVFVDVPAGGVKVTGVGIGETVIEPGTVREIKLERTYESARLCTGFILNGDTFVDFDDYPDGWTHTVSNKASAVTIVAQYKTVQDFYVDPVNGNDANCGFQTNRAWKTLATIATNGNVRAGDIVYAFPGTHAEGSVPRTEGDTTLNRVIVPAGVKLLALTDHGAKDTFICGATAPEADANGQGDGAVRCAFLEDGAEIRGFTLMGGHTATEVAGTASPNNSYAAVGTDYQNNDPVCAVVDCVISNNIAQWKCVGGPAYYIRCRMTENTGLSWNSGVEGAWLYNCFAKDNPGTYFVMSPKDFVNCTFLSGANVRNPNVYANLRNSVIYALTGCTVYNCVYGSCDAATSNTESSRQVDFSTLTFDEEGRCTAEVLRDFGLNEYLDPVPEEFRGVDRDGVQRVYNGAVDVGAYEYDKRGDFAADLGRKFAVDAATPGVTEVESSVRLTDGDALTLGWKPGTRPSSFALPFAITDGTLTVKVNGVVVATFDADGEWRITDVADMGTVELSFAASAIGGNAVFARSVSLSGLMLIFR